MASVMVPSSLLKYNARNPMRSFDRGIKPRLNNPRRVRHPPSSILLNSDANAIIDKVNYKEGTATALRDTFSQVFALAVSNNSILDKVNHNEGASTALQEDTFCQVDKDGAPQIQKWIDKVKGMFQSMSLGDISISPYNTAWVAMVPSVSGSNNPQFPKTLDWIIENQLSDGSWGDKEYFLSYDRLCNTVACLVALKTWNVGHDNIRRGMEFVHKNINKINEEVDDHMPVAFEIVFPTMLDAAKNLGIDLPYNSSALIKIQEERKKKLNRIPIELLHTRPTTLLHSLEGLHTLVDWNRIMNLQTNKGSFLFSPAATACALKYTSDEKCLSYLNVLLQKFHNSVPDVYPVDIFEHLWMVDRLERLGISRYFKKEIKESLDYVYKYWTPRGIAWASESNVFDADDTAMGFRLLRLHGYPVSPDVFYHFKKNNEFFCFEGQTSQAVTGMHNLYRASQIMLHNESILQEIQTFTKAFLIDMQDKGKIQDKWVISKGLKDEVAYSLNYPWYQSLPRIETRNFINHYGVDDAWIGKSLYRMFNVNNEVFLKLAKADYNLCQSLHQQELAKMLRWNEECEFNQLKFARQRSVQCFFSIAATFFEPEYSYARRVWTMCSVLTTVIDDFFDHNGTSQQEFSNFLDAVKCWDPEKAKGFSQEMRILFMGLYNTMEKIHQEALIAQGCDISLYLRNIWVKLVNSMYIEARWKFSNHHPTFEEYMNNAKDSIALSPIVQATLLFLGEKISEEDMRDKNYIHMMDLVNTIGRLNNDIQGFQRENFEGKWSCISIFLEENPEATEMEAVQHFKNLIEDAKKGLLEAYLQETRLSTQCKKLFLYMAKILNLFYCKSDGYTSITDVSHHVKNTLFVPIH